MTNSKPYKPTPADFDEACRLVGRFMNEWAFLERALNTGIASTLGMGNLEGIVVTSNMQVRSKIHIIKTLIDLRGVPKDWCATASKTIDAIATMSEQRNTVAHVPFGPYKGGGVEFLPIKAKGKLKFPDMIWKAKQFDAHSHEMDKLTADLKEIIKKLETSRAIMNAFAQGTTETKPEPTTLGHLLRLLQGNPNSLLANPEARSDSPPNHPGA